MSANIIIDEWFEIFKLRDGPLTPLKQLSVLMFMFTKVYLTAECYRIGLFNQISLEQCPGLAHLLEGGEQLESLMKMSPEAILLRWVNYQLERAGAPNRITNFTSDIKDSEAYTYLLHQIAAPDSGVHR